MKYELINSPIRIVRMYDENFRHIIPVTLKRIKALQDFSDVKAGDVGGWVESDSNLSQHGNCWIYDESEVHSGSVVSGNAIVKNGSKAKRGCHISGDSIVSSSIIASQVEIKDHVVVENSVVMGKVTLCEDVLVTRSTIRSEQSRINLGGGMIIANQNMDVDNAVPFFDSDDEMTPLRLPSPVIASPGIFPGNGRRFIDSDEDHIER